MGEKLCDKCANKSVCNYDLHCSEFKEKDEAELLSERIKHSKLKSHYETFQGEIMEYLKSKLRMYDIPDCTIMEIAQYVMSGMALVTNDEVRRAYRDWRKQMDKSIRRRGEQNGREQS